jgi:hypothetical protein
VPATIGCSRSRSWSRTPSRTIDRTRGATAVAQDVLPGCRFISVSSSTTLPVISVEFRHSTEFKVLETTTLGVLLMRSANGSSSAASHARRPRTPWSVAPWPPAAHAAPDEQRGFGRHDPSGARQLLRWPAPPAGRSGWPGSAAQRSARRWWARRAPGPDPSRPPWLAVGSAVSTLGLAGVGGVTRKWTWGWNLATPPAGTRTNAPAGADSAQQPQRPGAGDRLGAVGRPQLVEDVADVLFDGVQHHHQLLGDLLVGPAGRQQC